MFEENILAVIAVLMLALLAVIMKYAGRKNILRSIGLTYVITLFVLISLLNISPDIFISIMGIYPGKSDALAALCVHFNMSGRSKLGMYFLEAILVIYFMFSSRNRLRAFLMLPVIIVLHFVFMMCTAYSNEAMMLILIGIIIGIFKTLSEHGLSFCITNSPYARGTYHRRDRYERYKFSYETNIFGVRTVYLKDEKGNDIKTYIHAVGGSLYDSSGNEYIPDF